MAPEVFKGNYGFEIDIFSFGVILYRMFSDNDIVFYIEINTNNEELIKKLNNEFDELKIPISIKNLFLNLIDKDPEKRPKAKEIINVFNNFIYNNKNDYKKDLLNNDLNNNSINNSNKIDSNNNSFKNDSNIIKNNNSNNTSINSNKNESNNNNSNSNNNSINSNKSESINNSINNNNSNIFNNNSFKNDSNNNSKIFENKKEEEIPSDLIKVIIIGAGMSGKQVFF
jgi:serine/threonine protein kinase